MKEGHSPGQRDPPEIVHEALGLGDLPLVTRCSNGSAAARLKRRNLFVCWWSRGHAAELRLPKDLYCERRVSEIARHQPLLPFGCAPDPLSYFTSFVGCASR